MSKIAAIQMMSTHHVDQNLKSAAAFLGRAVSAGAQLIVLPEDFAFIGLNEGDKLTIKEDFGAGPVQAFLSEQAKSHQVWLIAGSVPLCTQDEHKCYSACLVFNDQGECVARYNKIHLFDVTVSDHQQYQETAVVKPGDDCVVLDTPLGRVGLSICYDLRFPELYRALLTKGAEIIVVPSAFTAVTGQAHWEVLLRARAIENLCYVVAANQSGIHKKGKETYGHSLIVDPWGVVLDCIVQGEGIVCADLDLLHLQTIRKHFPSISHRRI